MNGKKIVFYERELDWNKEFIPMDSSTLIFIRLDELKQSKSTTTRFIENELSSIPLINRILSSKIPFAKIIDSFLKSSKNGYGIKMPGKFQDKNTKYKLISDYIDAQIYERSDKTSVELYNKIRNTAVVSSSFNFSNINLYETNRLEFVEYYYQVLLIFFSVIKAIKSEKPSQIITLPSVNDLNRIIITSIAKKYKIQLEQNFSVKLKEASLLERYRLLIERLWYWNIYRILNRRNNVSYGRKNYSHTNLIFAHYKNHFPGLIQVLKAFKKTKGILNIIYTPHKLLTHAKGKIKKHNIKDAMILPHIDKKYSRFREYYRKFNKVLVKIKNTEDFADISIEDINISNLIKISFLRLYEKIVNSFRYLANIQQVLRKIRPNMIIFMSGNDAIDVLATRIAKREKIPSLFFPHALFSARRDHDVFEQDYVICAGKKDKDYFISLGTEEEKIHTLGLPLYDPLYEKYKESEDSADIRQHISKEFSLALDKKIILLVTTHDEDFVRERVFKSVVNLIKLGGNYEVIVKIHPVEEIDYYKALAKKFDSQDILILKSYALHKLILASDVVIGRSSGAQIEAILLNKDVINLSYEATVGRHKMDQFSTALLVYSPEELPKAVNKVLNDKETKNTLQEGRENYSRYILYKFDGKASMRIRDFIKNTLT